MDPPFTTEAVSTIEVTTSGIPVETTTLPMTTMISSTTEEIINTSSEETTAEKSTTTTQPDIDWEHVNELDEQEVQENEGLSTPVFASIIGTLIVVGSTIVCGIYQLCTPSNTTVFSNVTSVIS